MSSTKEPTQSRRLLVPFLRVLEANPAIPRELITELRAQLPTDGRIAATAAQELLQAALTLTNDPHIGLHAARATSVGDFEALEYLAASASDYRGVLDILLRYCKVIDGAADFRMDIREGRVLLDMSSSVPLAPAGVDYQLGAFFVWTMRWLWPFPPGSYVLFAYPRPDNVSEHAATFTGLELVFDAKINGFDFDASALQRPLRTADAQLHSVLRGHVERLLAELSIDEGWPARVRADLLANLVQGRPTVDQSAARLGVTGRTLTRRLQEANTQFKDLLADVRADLAKSYLRDSSHSIEDIAFLLGFSEAPPFVRAFRRWAGVTPQAFRRDRERT